MGVAEKLTTIAENQQKVYDAGYTKGQAEGGGVAEEIFFTSKGTMYKRNMVIPSAEIFHISLYTRAYEMETLEVPNMDAGTSVSSGVFFFCTALKTAYLPKIRRIGNQFFYGCTSLVQLTLGCAEVPMVQIGQTSLQNCHALVRFNLIGAIETSFGLPSSALLDDVSIQNIVGSLADLSGKTAQTLTLHGDVGAKLTEEQKATITAKNWTLVY